MNILDLMPICYMSPYIAGLSSSALTIDMMEYATDGAAQAAWVTSATTYTAQYPPAHSATYVKATTFAETFYSPHLATDPALSLIGAQEGTQWVSELGGSNITNQRFHIDLGSAKIINRIYYENGHVLAGTQIDAGINNFTFWGSNTGAGSFDDLVYANDEGWTQITGLSQSTFDIHSAANAADPKYITISGNSTSYRYYAFKIADNHGSTSHMAVRHIELQNTTALQSYSESTIKTQGSYALKLEATTGALNETVTKTLTGGDILDLTGKNTIKFDARSTATGGNLEFSIRDSDNENTGNLFIEAETDITDKNGTHTITAEGDAAVSTAQYCPYGMSSSSVVFDGNDYLSVPNSTDFQLSTGDFTVDMWIYPTSFAAVLPSIFGTSHSTGTEGISIAFRQTTGAIRYYNDNIASYLIDDTTTTFSINEWAHLAVVRSSGTTKIYKNGTLMVGGTVADANDAGSTLGLSIGRFYPNSAQFYFSGYIDNFRWIKGTALWTANFNLNDAELFYANKETHTITIASADTYQEESWDISGIADADKNAIDQLQLKVLNAGSARDYYIDNLRAE